MLLYMLYVVRNAASITYCKLCKDFKMEDATKELRKYAQKYKESNFENAERDVIPVVRDIAQKIEKKDRRFKIGEIEYTGSIHQKLRIDDTDEFDFNLPLLQLETHQINTFPSQGKLSSYSIVLFKE